MAIGFLGLGKMGGGMSRRLARAGVEVHGFAPSEHSREQAQAAGVTTHDSKKALLDALGENKIVWLMIPARLVEKEVQSLITDLPAGSILIDGGNTHFKQSIEHGKLATERGIRFLDIGVSGGQIGEEQGYSMMAGGNEDGWSEALHYVEALCQKNGFGYFGQAGAGHFVKMVHNAIEYGMMESLAEGFELVKQGPFDNVNLSQLATVWQNGSIIQSFLNGLAIDIFRENPNLEGIDGKVNMLGEAQWAKEFAEEIGIELTSVGHAIAKRKASQEGEVSFGTKYLAATRNAFGGHSLNKISSEEKPESTKNV